MIKKIVKVIVAVLYACLLCLAIVTARRVSIESLLEYSPSNPFLAALFLLGMYALKSISVFFPIILLQILAGFLFPAPMALFINLLGVVIASALPYLMGRFVGAEAAQRRINKNKKVASIIEKQKEHEFFLTFFLRVISCLPGDLVSMYLGALKFNFTNYLLASVLGILPGLIPATFMGQSITRPLSAEFIISLMINFSCALISMVVYYIYNKIAEKRES